MNCEEFLALIDLFDNLPDSPLGQQKRVEFRIHEKECPGCRAEFNVNQKIRAGLQRLSSVEVGEAQITDLKQKIRCAAPERTMTLAFWPALESRPFRFASAFALVFFAAILYRATGPLSPTVSPGFDTAQPPTLAQRSTPGVIQPHPPGLFDPYQLSAPLFPKNRIAGKPGVFLVSNGVDSPLDPRLILNDEAADQMDPRLVGELFSEKIEKFLMERYAIRSLGANRTPAGRSSIAPLGPPPGLVRTADCPAGTR